MTVNQTLSSATESPSLLLVNKKKSNAVDSRNSFIAFKGIGNNQSEHLQSKIESNHGYEGENKSGKLVFKVNDGNDADGNLHTILTLGPAEYKTFGTIQTINTVNKTIELENANNVSSNTDFYIKHIIRIESGNGVGETKQIIKYDGTNKIITYDSDWTNNPNTSSTYSIMTAEVTINGNLNANSLISSTNTTIKDTLIKLGEGLDEDPSKDLGIIFTRGRVDAGVSETNFANKGFIWDESTDEFSLITCNTEDGTTQGNITFTGYENLKLKDLETTGNAVITGTLDVTGITNINDTTESTDSTSGALIVDGGVGIAKNANIGGTLDVTGDSSVSTLDSSSTTSLATGGGAVNIATSGQLTTIKGTLKADEAVTIAAATTITTDNKIQFRDTNYHISSSTENQLDIYSGNQLNISSGNQLDISSGNQLNISSGVTLISTSVFTPSDDKWECVGHGLANGNIIRFKQIGTGPSEFKLNTNYYIKDKEDDYFKLALTQTGDSIVSNTDSAGTWIVKKISESNIGSTWTFDHSNDTWTCLDNSNNAMAHTLSNGDILMFTSGTGASPHSINQIYYVIDKATNTLKLSLTRGGTVINGTENHSTAWTAIKILSDLNLDLVSSYTFPSIDGTSGQLLKTDGNGNLSWGSVASPLTRNITGDFSGTATIMESLDISLYSHFRIWGKIVEHHNFLLQIGTTGFSDSFVTFIQIPVLELTDDTYTFNYTYTNPLPSKKFIKFVNNGSAKTGLNLNLEMKHLWLDNNESNTITTVNITPAHPTAITAGTTFMENYDISAYRKFRIHGTMDVLQNFYVEFSNDNTTFIRVLEIQVTKESLEEGNGLFKFNKTCLNAPKYIQFVNFNGVAQKITGGKLELI